jgi:riboflavin kinase/FMN adenylyltransferase
MSLSRIDNSIEAITLGSFDGMHVAHQALIGQAEAVAVIERQSGTLTPGYKRSWYTDKPMDFYLFEHIRSLSPEAFVVMLREHYPKLRRIVVGYDFHFGAGRGGSAETLKELFDGEVRIVPEISVEGVPVHARTIRGLLRHGDLALANRLLGRRYLIDGEPVKGQGLGSREFVPTVNLQVEGYELPAEGVYAGYTRLGERCYPSVIFLGYRDSTDGSFAVETHLLDKVIGPVEEPRVALEFEEFLRPNRRFDSPAELKEQIYLDIEKAMERLGLD